MNLLGIDYGEKRIGLALGDEDTKQTRPLITIPNDYSTLTRVKEIVNRHNIGKVIVGLPRGLDGQTTHQTHRVYDFIGQLKSNFELPIEPCDEAVTSEIAREKLGVKATKDEIDQEAAAIILRDYLDEARSS